MTIWVSSRFRAPPLSDEIRPVKVVSLLAPWDEFPVFSHLNDGQHLRLAFEDVEADDETPDPPMPEHVEQLIEFVSDWDRNNPILIHCWAGVSRSTASAFITACLLNPGRDESEIADLLRAASPTAKPNRQLVTFADSLLGRDGRMLKAVMTMKPHTYAEDAEPFALPTRFDDLRGHWV